MIQVRAIPRIDVLRWLRTEDWITFVLTAGVALIVINSIESAEWVATPSLPLAALLGAFAGLIIARSPLAGWQAYLTAAALGLLVVYLQALGLIEGETFTERIADLNTRLWAWLNAIFGNGISTDAIPFAVILSAVAWSAGYVSAWAVFRLTKIWIAIVPASVGLFINLTYLPETHFSVVFPFLLVTLLLVARFTSLQRQESLDKQGISYPASLRRVWIGIAVVFSSLIVGLVFVLPDTRVRSESLTGVWNVSREPASLFQQEFGRLFSAIESKKDSPQLFGPVLAILPNASISEEPVFRGDIPSPTYWKARAYTTYTSGGWTTDATVSETAFTFFITPESLALEDEPEEAQAIGGLSFRVQLESSPRYLYIPQTGLDSMPIRLEVETHAGSPVERNVITIRAEERLGEGDVYFGTMRVPVFTEAEIRGSDTDYPDWVTEHYLELPDSLPDRVHTLAQEVTQGAATPYDKALAIERYLRDLEYSTDLVPPRFDEDRVDHFLFESKAGHSDHFASAMTVMLRSAGIPARLVSGFNTGVVDDETRSFIIRKMDKHSWVETYFPGPGWIPFEPSPIFDPLPQTAQDYLILSGLDGEVPTSAPEFVPEESTVPETVEGPNEDLPGGREQGGEGGRPPPLSFTASPFGSGGLLLIITMVAFIAALWLLWHRFIMRLPRPEFTYFRMRRMAGLLVTQPELTHTPLEFGRLLSRAVPEAGEDIGYICNTYSRSIYGNSPISLMEGLRLRSAWNRVRKALVLRTFN